MKEQPIAPVGWRLWTWVLLWQIWVVVVESLVQQPPLLRLLLSPLLFDARSAPWLRGLWRLFL